MILRSSSFPVCWFFTVMGSIARISMRSSGPNIASRNCVVEYLTGEVIYQHPFEFFCLALQVAFAVGKRAQHFLLEKGVLVHPQISDHEIAVGQVAACLVLNLNPHALLGGRVVEFVRLHPW